MIIDISNLKFSRGNLEILDIPRWLVKQGEQIAIAGSSGSGKSTLLHILAGLLRPDAGELIVCGENLNQKKEAELDKFRANNIGYIFQNFNLLQGYTAIENILLSICLANNRADKEFAKQLLVEVGLSERVNHKPSAMSIGEQQRVAVARALANKPKLILADEPTGSLDPFHTGEVIEKLKQVCRVHNCTLIIVSHEENIINSFDKKISFLDFNNAFKKENK